MKVVNDNTLTESKDLQSAEDQLERDSRSQLISGSLIVTLFVASMVGLLAGVFYAAEKTDLNVKLFMGASDE